MIGRFTVITGHYGSGKTNLSINLALDLTATYDEVLLVDLDVVNPYFRSSDYAVMLEGHGVRVISPTFAGTTLDTPSLSAAVHGAFDTSGAVIFDVGGDDVGATALGRYSKEISAIDYDMLYVINHYRNLTAEPAEAAALLTEIEAACHLKATGVVNNSHLRDETTAATVLDSLDFAGQTAALLGLPLRFTTVPKRLAQEISGIPGAAGLMENAYPIEIHVRTPWEEAS
ncbi:MAG: ParA family protein [Coriobacteriia bacterium]|nr:ParA family protein [Coriobacteriia bacterium]MBN2847326.1 ParA family protein [Coriobacteriia bacterium]